VVRVGDTDPWLVHLEFQSTYDPTMGQRMLRYSSMLHVRHQIPVASVLVLLRPEADGVAIGGEYRLSVPYVARVMRLDGRVAAPEGPVITAITGAVPSTKL